MGSFGGKTFTPIRKSGSWPILGSRFQFENLLPGNLCQSVDLFDTESIFSIFHKGHKYIQKIDITWFSAKFSSVCITKTWSWPHETHFFLIFRISFGFSSNSGILSTKINAGGRNRFIRLSRATWALSNVNIASQTKKCYLCLQNRFSPKKNVKCQ